MPTTPKAPAKKTPAGTKSTRTRVRKTPVRPVKPVRPVLNEAQRQAKFEAYQTLSAANLPIPDDLKEVEGWIVEAQAQLQVEQETAAQQRAEAVTAANKSGPWYVRNGYPAPFNLRLDRQTEARRIQLQARGTPGDMHPLLDEDLKDPVLKRNLNLGVIEVIPGGEANLIMEKQTTNMGRRVHTPLAVLRSETGRVYEQGEVRVEAEFNSQGVTVAQIDPRVRTGELHDREVGGTRGTGGITRAQPGQSQAQSQAQPQPQSATSVVRSGFVPTGGNQAIIHYGPLGPNAQAKVVDDLARRKDIQGPGAGLGEMQVIIDPVVRT